MQPQFYAWNHLRSPVGKHRLETIVVVPRCNFVKMYKRLLLTLGTFYRSIFSETLHTRSLLDEILYLWHCSFPARSVKACVHSKIARGVIRLTCCLFHLYPSHATHLNPFRGSAVLPILRIRTDQHCCRICTARAFDRRHRD